MNFARVVLRSMPNGLPCVQTRVKAVDIAEADHLARKFREVIGRPSPSKSATTGSGIAGYSGWAIR
jgi:hypothetical protein